jgi:hypothetical protein
MEYNLNGKITFSDYTQFNKYFSKKGFFKRLKLIIYPLLLCMVIVFIILDINIFIEIYKSSKLNLLKIIIPFIILIFILIIYKIFIEFMVSKAVFKNNKIFKVLQHNHKIKINEETIIIETIESKKLLSKVDKINIKYDNGTIYIFNGFILEFIINKIFIEDENKLEEIIEFIKLNFGKK